MATLVTYYKADNAGVRSSWGEALAFINTIAKERNKLRAENERLRAALMAITSEDGAYMACSDLPWCQASGSGPGSHHAENCAVGIALAALASVKETK